MDSYSTLLSPIDNFAFSQFTNSGPSGGSPAPRGKTSPQNGQQELPRTPLPKSSGEWGDLLDGQQGHMFNMWEDGAKQQASGSPWRPHVFRALSDSFLDSPLSSSSFLSSASGSPSVVPSSTCSPWETCPGLAPASPEIPLFNELTFGLSGSVNASTEEASAYAFHNLSLGSPLHSPISLSYQGDSILDSYNFAGTHSNTSNTVEPSHLMSNALGLDLSGSDNSNTAATSSNGTGLLPPFSYAAANPPQTKRSASLPKSNDASPSPPRSTPSQTAGSFDTFPPSSGFPSEAHMQNRVTRRKASHVDYAEAAYDGDSDDDAEDSESNNAVRFGKRRKPSAETASFSFSESDEDLETGDFGVRRGRKGGKRFPGIKGNMTANAKRKSKRRHPCPLDGCKQTFTRVTDMARHLSSVHRTHDTDANRCTFCHKAFSRDDAVLRHENDSCPMRPRKKAASAELWG